MLVSFAYRITRNWRRPNGVLIRGMAGRFKSVGVGGWGRGGLGGGVEIKREMKSDHLSDASASRCCEFFLFDHGGPNISHSQRRAVINRPGLLQ